jgi:hypothetical protein
MGKVIDIEKIKQLLRKRDSQRNSPYHNIRTGSESLGIDSHILLAHLIYAVKSLTNTEKVTFLNGTNFIDKEILFQKISYEEMNLLDSNYNFDKTKKHKLVFGNFPFGTRHPGIDNSKDSPRMDSSTNLIIESADLIDEYGFGIYLTLPYGRVFRVDKIREHLSEKNYFVNGIISLPERFYTHSGISGEVIIISKHKTDKEFILNIDSLKSFNFDLGNMFNEKSNNKDKIFIDHDYNDLDKGVWLTVGEFDGFDAYRLNNELKSIEGDFTTFRNVALTDLCKEMIMIPGTGKKDFDDLNDTVYLPLIGTQSACIKQNELKIKPFNYIQLVVDSDKILNTYLCHFLNSKLGKKIIQVEVSKIGGIIPRLRKSTIGSMPIRVPSIEVQKQVISVIEKFKILVNKINDLGESVMRNPISDSKSLEQIDVVIESIGLLTTPDKIRNFINAGETKNLEFKQTIKYDVRREKVEQIITDMWIKTVAAFLNTDGGDLLIGVSDNKKVTGMKFEIDKFFKQSEDKLMQHVKNILKDYIGEPFYPFIDAQLVAIDSDYVLWINCKPSDKEVFVKGKDFYVRTHPATDKLEGQKAIEYIKRRFLE